MSETGLRGSFATPWPAIATTALRVAFGIVWAVGAALTWSPDFAVHYVGYLHNAAQGQPAWLSGWFSMWIGLVTPHVVLFTWLTRIAESFIALALLVGFGRKSLYLFGALFSLLIWSTAEGFGGPYTVGATNMGTAISYVLIFAALIGLDYRAGFIPYSLDYLIERHWPAWQAVAEWRRDRTAPHAPVVLPWRVQIPALFAIVVLLAFLIGGLHSALNVQPPSPGTAAAAVSPLTLASKEPIANTRDALLPPLIGTGDSVDVRMVARDDKVTIASGVNYNAWTFNGMVPAPILHVRQGQTVNVTFINRGLMPHSIDFHAAQTPPDLHYVDIQPGEQIKFSFVARVPGVFLYHCGTAPVLLHIGNGMYGALVVDPAEPLPPADKSYVIVQSEWYTQQVGDRLMGPDFDKMKDVRPDEVVFNGAAFQYIDHPLAATAGERTRIYLVNAGPNLWTSFHLIGEIFDKVYPDGNAANALSGVSTYPVAPGAGAIFDVVIRDPGEYVFVDHAMAHAIIGAKGILDVRTAGASAGARKPAPPVTSAPRAAAPAGVAAGPAGPYQFDAAKGNTLYMQYCSACHQSTGLGLKGAFPPLKGDFVVLNPDATHQIQTILYGLHDKEIDDTVYPTPMPPFGSVLNDAQIADIINHERSSWGNQGKPVTAADVEAVRSQGPGD